MSVVVLKSGLLTTLQDRGRRGLAALGIGHAGPMDEVSFRLANALVGNDDSATALEITLLGPRLRFDADAVIALTGAEFPARIDDFEIPAWQPLRVAAGAVLDIGNARRGARGYLAVADGFVVERTLGSAATDVNARIGPLRGRALATQDALALSEGAASAAMPFGSSRDSATEASPLKPLLPEPSAGLRPPSSPQNVSIPAWSLDPRPWFDSDPARPIRLIRGAHFDALDAASRAALFDAEFRIASESNRVGFRLDGPRLALAAPLELVSAPVASGTLQLPPGGQPIALMVEHPTTGGYPRIGQIATIDLPRLAQRRSGERVRFREISLDEAQTRYLERERELARLFDAIATRLNAND
ncbi:biotin-dependent carboxyltransferase family protein [Dokdonella soli]|uniref:5-oxoprolinase subunit PxpC n=1 Tax=Dokdonella soli TaxID=529810 RepID=A0ABN1IBJ4_9GAMM